MKGNMKALVGHGLWWCQVISALEIPQEQSVTATNHVDIIVRAAGPTPGHFAVDAVVPNKPGQIGINPPGAEPKPANIQGHEKYLSLEGGNTKWIGSDPNNIAVKTTTTTKAGGATAVATITKGVEVSKNAAGGLDVLLSPAVKAKLEAIAKQVKPCAAKRRRGRGESPHNSNSNANSKRQGGPSCGLADFVQRVGEDTELQSSFEEPLTDQAWYELDEGYASGDGGQDDGWEGDGGEHVPGEEDEGFFEGAEGAGGESTTAESLETVVFASEEEAAALGAALSGGDAAAAAAAYGGSTVTAGSFMAWLWKTLEDGKTIPNANAIPKESIHTVTKTKTKTTTTTTSPANCPTGPPPHNCEDDCVPTSTQVVVPAVTGIVDWICSDGKTKGCRCDPQTVDRTDLFDANTYQAILDAINELSSTSAPSAQPTGHPKCATTTNCDISDIPSNVFQDGLWKGYCDTVNKDSKTAYGEVVDGAGNAIPTKSKAKNKAVQRAAALLQGRTPPPNPNSYTNYSISLVWSGGDGSCPHDCGSAWSSMAGSPCGHQGGQSNLMTSSASLDTGCGVYSYTINPPPGTPSCAPPTPVLACNGIVNVWWIPDTVLATQIPIFCKDATAQGVQDKNSGSIVREYNTGTVNDVTISMEWPSGADFSPDVTECTAQLTKIMEGCDGNDDKNNPMNWKHGGKNTVGNVTYEVTPEHTRYNPGICTVDIREDLVGHIAAYKYKISVNHLDSLAKSIGGDTSMKAKAIHDLSATAPYTTGDYYETLTINLLKTDNQDALSFQIGSQTWQTTSEGTCGYNGGGSVGAWDGSFQQNRHMSCTFDC